MTPDTSPPRSTAGIGSRCLTLAAVVAAAVLLPAGALALVPSNGLYYGSCGKGSGGPTPCGVSLLVTSNGQKITHLRFEPPSCIINNNTVTTTPIQPGGSFNVTLTYQNVTHTKITITGKFVSASKADVTLVATCQGFGTKTRKLTLVRAAGK